MIFPIVTAMFTDFVFENSINLIYAAFQTIEAPTPSITDWLNLVVLSIQTLGAIVAAVFAWKAYLQTKQISNEQIKQTEKIHEEQTTFAQNQAFIALFEYLKNLREIPPVVQEWDDVINNVNLIEVIGIARAKNLVDEELLFVVYGKLIVKIYEQIRVAKDATTGDQKGQDILNQAVAAVAIYRRWKKRIDDEARTSLDKYKEN